MTRPSEPDISRALEPLRDIVDSLARAAAGAVPLGSGRQRAVRRVRSAGNAAIPVLIRGLRSLSESEATWAYYLLGRLGGPRVVARLGLLLDEDGASDEVKARALGLLSELRAPVPQRVTLKDPDGMLARSVAELLSSLKSAADLTEAVGLILEQVPMAELPSFAAELMRHGGRRATRLLDLLLAQPHLPGPVSDELCALKTSVRSPDEQRTDALHAALDRGLEYLETGRPHAARRRIQRFVDAYPDRADGHSALGVCLLELGRPDVALPHLERACALEPDEPLHVWNVASACKQAERMGGCYLALRRYLERDDRGDDATGRRNEARSFVRSYERMLRTSHPGGALADVLRGDELFARAHAALAEGLNAEAARGFEAVLALQPRHYPSWGNLGAAYLALDRQDKALICLRRALELNPEYAAARQHLALLEELR
jgi:tetratricopeptide (TPR) repeat protein